MDTSFKSEKDKAAKMSRMPMGSTFHMLCQRYSGSLTPAAPEATRPWKPLPFFQYGPTFKGKNLLVDAVCKNGRKALTCTHIHYDSFLIP